jgi:hypothetical protein
MNFNTLGAVPFGGYRGIGNRGGYGGYGNQFGYGGGILGFFQRLMYSY